MVSRGGAVQELALKLAVMGSYHTGQGFSYLWSALNASVGGPEAAAAFFRKASWHFDLVRRSDGSFTYDGDEQYGAGKTDDGTYYGKSSYNGLSPAATYVLTYALPLRKLVITGRDANRSGWLDRKQAAATVAAGRFDLDRREMAPQELVEAFGNWSPIVRSWAAEELAKQPESRTMVASLAMKEIIVMFDKDTAAGAFPPSLNKDRVAAVEDAIRSIETASTQPELRSIRR